MSESRTDPATLASTLRGGSLVVVSAPSGTGKSSLVRRVLALDSRVKFSISATTRAPRNGETADVDYHFLDRATFETCIAAGDFLEHAEVHGNLYGTLRATVDDMRAAGRDVLLDIDVQGARLVAAADPSAHLVFIAPPSRAELERRIRGRGLDAADVIERRLVNAVGEMAALHHFDSVVINDNLDDAARDLLAVMTAGRLSPLAQRVRLDTVVGSFGLPRLPDRPERWTS